MYSRKEWYVEGTAVSVRESRYGLFILAKGKISSEAFQTNGKISVIICDEVEGFDSFNPRKRFKLKGRLVLDAVTGKKKTLDRTVSFITDEIL